MNSKLCITIALCIVILSTSVLVIYQSNSKIEEPVRKSVMPERSVDSVLKVFDNVAETHTAAVPVQTEQKVVNSNSESLTEQEN